MRENSEDGTASVIPAGRVDPVPTPTTANAAVSAVKDLLEAMRGTSDIFAPLETALDVFLKIWDVYDVRHSIRAIFVQLMHAAR